MILSGLQRGQFYSLRETTIGNRLGHLQIYKRGPRRRSRSYGLEDVQSIRKRIEQDPRVSMTAAQITLMGLISNGDKSEAFLGTAVEPSKDTRMRAQRLVSGREPTDKELDT
jgi:ABC-type lipoprotein release transport system permease subunit